jgi:hypothetical protein
MIIPKSKRKRRRMFIELNYLDKTSFEAAKDLIATGDIGNVILGIETLMQSPRTTSMKKAFDNNFALDDFHDDLEDEGYSIDYGTPSKQDFEIEED